MIFIDFSMTIVMCLHCSMQEKGICEHIALKVDLSSVIYVHFSELVNHCVTKAYSS